MTRKSMAHLYS